MVSVIDVDDEEVVKVFIKERFAVETLVVVIMNFDSECIEEYEKTTNALQGMGSHHYAPKKLDLDLKNRQTPPA